MGNYLHNLWNKYALCTPYVYSCNVFSLYILGPNGGILPAIVIGILVGHLMPMDVEGNLSPTDGYTSGKNYFFILIGKFTGFVSLYLKMHLIKVHKTLKEISFVYGNILKTFA